MPDQLNNLLRGQFLRGNRLKAAVAIGGVVAATALVEAALIPGLAIGAAVIVTPRLLSRRPRRRTPPAPANSGRARPIPLRQGPAHPVEARPTTERPTAPVVQSLRLKEATLKTISFRVISTGLDFGFNYVVLGELATAAGLSTISIVAGPFFYFLHETGWTYIKPLLPAATADRTDTVPRPDYHVMGYRVSHTLAKTITFRVFATASEFSTNYIVVQDLVTAAWLSSFGFFIGPFVYFAHERLWERFDAKDTPRAALARPTLELAPS